MIIFLVIFVLVILFYLFLICPRLFHKPDYSAFLNQHYAHRGLFDNTTNAPENSLAAFKKAVDAGYGIELDVQLSKDEVPVVFHDADLKRMCHVEGHVWDYTYTELRQLRLADSNETIPSLAEVLNLVNGKSPLIVEYKMDIPKVRVCELGDQLLSNYNGVYCIESFHPYALMWYKKHRPDVMRGQLSEEYFKQKRFRYHIPLYAMSYLLTNVVTRPDFIAYKHQDASNPSRKICKYFGALSIAFTVKSKEQFEDIKEQFDLFIFDSFML